MRKTKEFTVTIPGGDMREDLQLCGTKSGRDMDKLAAAKLKTAPAAHLATPRLDWRGIHFEYKVLDLYGMNDTHLDTAVKQSYYKDNDYHTIYV